MKKLLGALAVFALALVLVLVPSLEAKADFPVCPECQESCSPVSTGSGTHRWVCVNSDCKGYQQTVGDPESCSGGTATCAEPATCEKCGSPYGEKNPDNHTWGKWTKTDDLIHTRTCTNEKCGKTETQAHSDRWASFCNYQPHCEICDADYGSIRPHEIYYEDRGERGHKPCCYHCDQFFFIESHSGGEATCTEKAVCEKCGAEYGEPMGHDVINHEAKAPNCTEIGWDAYETCSRCDYTTYAEKPALGHDIVNHEAKAPNCTEIGWDAYDTCSRCDYSTYTEKAALGHDLAMTAKVDPTCTGSGAEAFFTCRRGGCGRLFSDAEGLHEITAPAAIPATGHTETADPAVEATCTTDGLTAGSHCSVCEAVLTMQETVPAPGHSYGTWKPSARRRHAHSCFRCGDETRAACVLVTVPIGSDNSLMLCPICGYREEMESMAAVQDARIVGKYLDGNLTVFLSGAEEECRLLSVAFESDGRLLRFDGEVMVVLPAGLINGCGLVLIGPDGAEYPVEYTVKGDWIELTLTFPQDDQPEAVQILKLIA